MCSIVQMWTCLLLILASVVALHSSPVYFYPKSGDSSDPYNSGGIIVKSDDLPSLFNALYDDSPSSKLLSKRNIAIGRGDGFRPGK